jgi:hypothetical protein
MSTAPAFASATQALDMVRAGLRFLATADVTQLTVAEQAACLRGLEHADAAATAARTSMLAGFGASQGYADDGDYSLFAWLRHRTQVTRGTAGEHTAWLKRSAAHPDVHAALAAEAISKSYAREICRWTGSLPDGTRAAADEILLAAAASGLELEDLAGLAAEMYEKSRQDKPGTGILCTPRRAISAVPRTGTAGILPRPSAVPLRALSSRSSPPFIARFTGAGTAGYPMS